MEGFKNSTRMTVISDAAPQAYAKGGSVKAMAKVGKVMSEFGAGKLHSGSKKGPEVTNKKQAVAIALSEARKAGAKFPIKREGGGSSALTRAEREAMMEETSRAMTPAQTRALQAYKTAQDAAPKRGPLIQPKKAAPPVRKMTPAERRMNEMDRPTNDRGAEAYKGGGKVGASKVPFFEKKTGEKYASKGAMTKHERGESFAVKVADGEFGGKKVMRKAMGGAVVQPPPMPYAPQTPSPAPPMPSAAGAGYAPPPGATPPRGALSAGMDPRMSRIMELAQGSSRAQTSPMQPPLQTSPMGQRPMPMSTRETFPMEPMPTRETFPMEPMPTRETFPREPMPTRQTFPTEPMPTRQTFPMGQGPMPMPQTFPMEPMQKPVVASQNVNAGRDNSYRNALADYQVMRANAIKRGLPRPPMPVR